MARPSGTDSRGSPGAQLQRRLGGGGLAAGVGAAAEDGDVVRVDEPVDREAVGLLETPCGADRCPPAELSRRRRPLWPTRLRKSWRPSRRGRSCPRRTGMRSPERVGLAGADVSSKPPACRFCAAPPMAASRRAATVFCRRRRTARASGPSGRPARPSWSRSRTGRRGPSPGSPPGGGASAAPGRRAGGADAQRAVTQGGGGAGLGHRGAGERSREHPTARRPPGRLPTWARLNSCRHAGSFSFGCLRG
jgi:hypothetical protein